ncbi:MAG: dihydrolipoyl dehydrogenase [Bacilli bacterium]|nr:dihydrolipoyl dehydrogenase [Bacilli bacterium]
MEKLFKDLVIIGAGPGGYELASMASNANLDTILFEKSELGGTCLNCGCIPTKTYFQYAKVREQAAKLYGQELEFNFNDLYNSKNETVDVLKQGIKASLSKVLIINEEARLSKDGDKTVIVSENYLVEAKNIVIATGSTDAQIKAKGIKYVINSKELLDLDHLPTSISIIGGGVIGMEVASIYNALGVKVNVFEYAPMILPRFDKEVSRRLTNILKAKGINIYNNAGVSEIKKVKGGFKTIASLKDKTIEEESEIVLCATGRIPNVNDLGLKEAGVRFDKKGIKVNKNLQTKNSSIYAIGDCVGGIMLAHKASFDAKVVLNQILNNKYKVNYDLIPACCFTLPEVSSIGLTEDEAKDKYGEVRVVKELYRANGKAQAIKETDGFVKLVIKNDLIIGASIIGEEANLLIHEVATLMNAKVKVSEAKKYIHAHPTLSEIIQSCLQK